MTNYFECSFSKTYPPTFDYGVNFPTTEPCPYPCEKGIWHWCVVRRTKEPYGGNIRLIRDPVDVTRACAEFILDYPGARPLPDDQDAKLLEHQDLEPANYSEPYPTLKEAYYNIKYWFPSDFKVEVWRNIWQICGEKGVYAVATYKPQLSLVFGREAPSPYLGLNITGYYYPDGVKRRLPVIKIADIPKDRWVPITVYVKQGSSFRSLDGTVIVWIDNVQVFEAHNLPTSTYSGTPYVIWGIGNYGGPEELLNQTILFKDIIVADERITDGPTPTPPLTPMLAGGIGLLVVNTALIVYYVATHVFGYEPKL